MAEVMVKQAPKGNGKPKEVPLIGRADVKLAEAVFNRWFVVVAPEQFADRMNGALWTAKSQDLRRYDQIFCLSRDERECATLLVADVEVGYVELVQIGDVVSLPPKRAISGPRVPDGYSPERTVQGYRMRRVADGCAMTAFFPRLEDAVRALLDHANLRQVVR